MQLQPTLLIHTGQITGPSLELLRISNRHCAFFSVKDNVIDVFCAKAVYCGNIADSNSIDESAYHIGLLPLSGRLPMIDRNRSDDVAREFQSKFLAYRCRYMLNVRDSQFDLPEFASGTRILARILGGPMVDAPALLAGLAPLLHEHEEKRQEFQLTDLRCVVLEAVIHHLHKEPGAKVHVGEITETMMGILKGRGDSTEYDPKEIGFVLRRSFRVRPKRDGEGFAIRLDSALSRDMHLFAHRFGVLARRERKVQCPYCDEISDAARSNKPSFGGQKKV
jgi:hypothetical protein